MKIAVYPFASTPVISENLAVIRKAVSEASENGVRLLVFHECALCGYPPVETAIEEIRREEVEAALNEIAALAERYAIYVAVGTVRFEDGGRWNSIVLFNDKGSLMGCYDKQALWGWDTENFARGNGTGVFGIDGINVGFRICFDVRFPEPFRELYKQNTDICFVSFSDTDKAPNPTRYDTIKAHLITRAVENVMTVVSVNSAAGFQTAPTAVFDCNGAVKKEAKPQAEGLLAYEYEKPEASFGMRGRIQNNAYFLNKTNAGNECPVCAP